MSIGKICAIFQKLSTENFGCVVCFTVSHGASHPRPGSRIVEQLTHLLHGNGSLTEVSTHAGVLPLLGCGFNRSMQHPVSIRREEDVADEEIPTADLSETQVLKTVFNGKDL
jgi:hypothetical protein